MGREQRARDERLLAAVRAGELRTGWLPAGDAPRDAWPIAISATIMCDCGKGGTVILTGGRQNGEWVIDGDFEHAFEITDFQYLGEPPMRHLN